MTDHPQYVAPEEILKITCPILTEAGEPVTDATVVFEYISATEAREQITALLETGHELYHINGGFRINFEDTFTDYVDARCLAPEWRRQ